MAKSPAALTRPARPARPDRAAESSAPTRVRPHLLTRLRLRLMRRRRPTAPAVPPQPVAQAGNE